MTPLISGVLNHVTARGNARAINANSRLKTLPIFVDISRRFTAILAADDADYPQLMGGDEAGKLTQFMQTRASKGFGV